MASSREKKRKSIVFYAIIGVLFFGVLPVLTAFYINLPKALTGQLVNYSFENEFISGDITINNHFRSRPAAPNDELEYKVLYKNKADFPLSIDSQLEVIVGGDVFKQFSFANPLIVEPFSSKEHYRIFFSDREGLNQIRLISIISNATSGDFVTREESTWNIPVISLSDQLQTELNGYTLIGLIMSIGVGLVTVVALVTNMSFSKDQVIELRRQNKNLEEQVSLTKTQMNAQLRPWLGREDLVEEGIFLPNREQITAERVNEMIRLGQPLDGIINTGILFIKNYGQLPAENVRFQSVIQLRADEPTAEVFNNAQFGPPAVVMPGETVPLRFDIPVIARLRTLQQEPPNRLFIMYHIEYSYPNGSGLYEVIIEFVPNRFVVRHYRVQ
ncbi:hypothetical protein Ngar_c12460 [Candidatus Nitrososphaera gargensis Ga9.2]|uniref:Uncharacterized protein n=1 Tax=Nitrososphaera gargensis (strain Ga9.2) TaxID=1237085 RepID=K0IA57_NITGG|nr:hypothetical protein [Candidatus Nitrososphaera gargensis]AFU58186.1 hypothetical protein Ngar_c12460 [Candidatus Nitrososphaera gargensis Ga9.2]